MKVRVVSDGTPAGTRVEDIETGDLLRGVAAVAFEIGIESTATVLLRVKNVPVNIVGDLDIERSTIEPGEEKDLLENSVTIRPDDHDHAAPGPAAQTPAVD